MLIRIDYQDARPIYEQITAGFEKLILSGVLEPDEQLPSVRGLAVELSTNPNTVQKAYAALERNGFIYTVKGRGNFVSGNVSLINERKRSMREQIEAILKEADELGIDRKELLEGLGGKGKND
ncbi:MAG: GntR family transcriptional regulator [Lachnospiraceae bacterium]|nr:GntR family transcriptional regulator [Lachnospiraceae bacterium]